MKKVTKNPPSIHPNFIGTCIMCNVIYLMDLTTIYVVLEAVIYSSYVVSIIMLRDFSSSLLLKKRL